MAVEDTPFEHIDPAFFGIVNFASQCVDSTPMVRAFDVELELSIHLRKDERHCRWDRV